MSDPGFIDRVVDENVAPDVAAMIRADERARLLRELRSAPIAAALRAAVERGEVTGKPHGQLEFIASLLAPEGEGGLNNSSGERALLTQDDESVSSAPLFAGKEGGGEDHAASLAAGIRSLFSSLPFAAPEAVAELAMLKLRGPLEAYEQSVPARSEVDGA